MGLSEAASAVGGTWAGDDVRFVGCETDGRTLSRGALFAALRGERFDGHDFIEQAQARGAAAALVERSDIRVLPTVVVSDTRRALGRLAGVWRRRFPLPVVAVTGSNGKTTVKEMLASILSEEGPVLATRGNLNNDVGLPLTLFRLAADHRFAVLELGANHQGEIAQLAALAAPAVGIITQCAPAHLEGFGSIEAVARAKGELLEGLDADGTAIINADDDYAGLWRTLAGRRRLITFGLKERADVSASHDVQAGFSGMELTTPAGRVGVRLALPGSHNVANALAAAAAAIALEIPLSSIKVGLERMTPVRGRLQMRSGIAGTRIIDDTYNANPGSLKAALGVLQSFGGRRWLVLGDMAELGEAASDYHEQVGRMAKEAGVERIYATGPLSRSASEAFGAEGRHYGNQEALIEALRPDLAGDVVLLVKGSRSSLMERVIEALSEES